MSNIAELIIHDLVEDIPRNAKQPKIPLRTKPATMIALHCDDAANWDVWDLINYDLRPNHISSKGCPCPTYAYWISRRGTIYKVAQEAYATWHAGVGLATRQLYRIPDWNQVAIAICFAHKPGAEDGLTDEQLEAGQLLCAEIALRRNIQSADIKGHRELAGSGYYPKNPARLRKTCPGLDVDLVAFRAAVRDLKVQALGGKLAIDVKTVRGG